MLCRQCEFCLYVNYRQTIYHGKPFLSGKRNLSRICLAFLRGKWTLRLMPEHTHINLFGWISMLIFGFAYSYLPTFAGKTLYSTTLSYIHFICGNIGLIGMACSGLEADSPIPRFYLSLSGLSGAFVILAV